MAGSRMMFGVHGRDDALKRRVAQKFDEGDVSYALLKAPTHYTSREPSQEQSLKFVRWLSFFRASSLPTNTRAEL